MSGIKDGPTSSLFFPVPIKGNKTFTNMAHAGISSEMSEVLENAPSGACIGWGIPLEIGDVILLTDQLVN